jgi:MscS family membrane protein
VTWFIRVDAFNDSSIDFLLYCFTKTTNWVEWLEIKEALALRIKEIVEGAGTGFAFPSRTIYMAQDGDGDAAEPFTPPEGKKAA